MVLEESLFLLLLLQVELVQHLSLLQLHTWGLLVNHHHCRIHVGRLQVNL